jgi:hypothetical protein
MMGKLQVVKKLEDWLVLIQPCLANFPKTTRFSLVQKIENTSLECIDLVISANLDKPRRAEHILRARVATERLQVLVRVSRARSLIDMKHYEMFSERITEISKMLAGWARAKG